MIAAVGLGLMGVHIRISLNDYTVIKWTKGYLRLSERIHAVRLPSH